MAITEFTDRIKVKAFLESFEKDLQGVCDKYGLTYTRTKAKYSSKALSLSCELRPGDSPFSETGHARADKYAESHGVEFGEHFIGSKYRIYYKKRYHDVTVAGIDFKARKYTVRLMLEDGTHLAGSIESLKGRYSSASPSGFTPSDIYTYMAYTYDDDRMSDSQTNTWDAVDAAVAKIANPTQYPTFYELLDIVAERYEGISSSNKQSICRAISLLLDGKKTVEDTERLIAGMCDKC
jgi:hypothetical protein